MWWYHCVRVGKAFPGGDDALVLSGVVVVWHVQDSQDFEYTKGFLFLCHHIRVPLTRMAVESTIRRPRSRPSDHPRAAFSQVFRPNRLSPTDKHPRMTPKDVRECLQRPSLGAYRWGSKEKGTPMFPNARFRDIHECKLLYKNLVKICASAITRAKSAGPVHGYGKQPRPPPSRTATMLGRMLRCHAAERNGTACYKMHSCIRLFRVMKVRGAVARLVHRISLVQRSCEDVEEYLSS